MRRRGREGEEEEDQKDWTKWGREDAKNGGKQGGGEQRH